MKDVALITGSAGLIGSEAARFFSAKGMRVVGVDNDLRRHFFGPEASTAWLRDRLLAELPDYEHHAVDIRDGEAIQALFARHGAAIQVVIHTAAQPSHDWAAGDPVTDFTVNANGTLNLLEATRRHAPGAAFIFTSTNNVYGDTPNHLPLVELPTRWEVESNHPYFAHGIDEGMSIDASQHTIFGASKVAADVMVQEYGRYFDLKTVAFRGGCLTGPAHSAARLHGFLAYLMKCAVEGEEYTVLGYQGKQVRDNIHSRDLVSMFWHYFESPRRGEVYNAGGGRECHCSMVEAIELCSELTGRPVAHAYSDAARRADHVWWVSDTRKFRSHYPGWRLTYGLRDILEEIRDACVRRGPAAAAAAPP